MPFVRIAQRADPGGMEAEMMSIDAAGARRLGNLAGADWHDAGLVWRLPRR